MDRKLKQRIEQFLANYDEAFEKAIEKDEHDGNVLKTYQWINFCEKAVSLLEEIISTRS